MEANQSTVIYFSCTKILSETIALLYFTKLPRYKSKKDVGITLQTS